MLYPLQIWIQGMHEQSFFLLHPKKLVLDTISAVTNLDPKEKKRKQEEEVERKREETQQPNMANGGSTSQNGTPARLTRRMQWIRWEVMNASAAMVCFTCVNERLV